MLDRERTEWCCDCAVAVASTWYGMDETCAEEGRERDEDKRRRPLRLRFLAPSNASLMSFLRPRLSHLPCTCRTFSTCTTLGAPYAYTTLPTRSLLTLSGPDTTKFLQGLLTNDVRRLGTVGSSGERGLYAALLKADVSPLVPTSFERLTDEMEQGRMIQDVFVYPHTVGEVPGYLLESEAEMTDTLRTYLKRHILRSKVKLGKSAEVDSKVHVVWRTEEEASEEVVRMGEEWLEGVKAGRDSRTTAMGWRWAGPEVIRTSLI